MSKNYFLLIVCTAFLSLISCSKAVNNNVDDESGNNSSDKDHYYVKYIANTSDIAISEVIINTEKGQLSLPGTGSFEEIIGPVEKGFEAFIEVIVKNGQYRNGSTQIEIYSSINNEPFALKLHERGSLASPPTDTYPGSMSATYIVGE